MSDDAIPAATLVVWRDGPNGPDILVVERASTMAFAAGAVVFPGGRVDAQDRALAARLGRPDEAARVTAIRETLEESAVAPALIGIASPDHGRALQAELVAGRPFTDLLSGHGLTLDLDALTPFARWMPAFKQPRKFDTLFYVAPAPAGDWAPHPQDGECVSAEWQSPAAVLDAIAEGTRSAIFPTKRNLERLAQFASFAEARAQAEAIPVQTICPRQQERDGEVWLTIPEGLGYPVTGQAMSTVRRG